MRHRLGTVRNRLEQPEALTASTVAAREEDRASGRDKNQTGPMVGSWRDSSGGAEAIRIS